MMTMKKTLTAVFPLVFALILCSILFACDHEEGPGGDGTETAEQIGNREAEYMKDIAAGQTVEYANEIADKVNVRYRDGKRSGILLENAQITLNHGTNAAVNHVDSLVNPEGGVYLRDTGDVFVRMEDGRTFTASDWLTGCSFNAYRAGYYYYDAHITDQGFGDNEKMKAESFEIPLENFSATNKDTSEFKVKNGVLSCKIAGTTDPGIQNMKVRFKTADYDALVLTMKNDSSCRCQLFLRAGNNGNFTGEQSLWFSLIPGDDYHTYIIPLSDLPGYEGNVTGIRFDLGAGARGEKMYISSLRAVRLEGNTVPLRLDRGYHLYSDKLHEELHFVATEKADGIAALGTVTRLPKASVSAMLLHDKNGDHDSPEGVDFASLEYAGFDVTGAGILGFILPYDGESGKMTVTEEGEDYVITREFAPTSGRIKKGGSTSFGHRIYTDTTHTFARFSEEAWVERHPLGEDSIRVRGNNDGAEYVGYDVLRGAYRFNISGTDFSTAYYKMPNRHFTADVVLSGKDKDRRIYVYTRGGGNLECAVAMDENDGLLPIPLEVIKNFAGDGDESLYLKDKYYDEVILPVVLDADKSVEIKLAHLYQNWGKYPLKQLSVIQSVTPAYYHISTGVTETNCISTMYGTTSWLLVNDLTKGYIYPFHVISGKTLDVLPDFRGMSGEIWTDQPQHNSAGAFSWIKYTDKDGKFSASEFVRDEVPSYGPIYSDIAMRYVTDDGKIDATYRHVEMPQTDETRAYYQVSYEVKDTLTIKDFKNDFSIMEVNSRFNAFNNLGYLDKDGKSVVTAPNSSEKPRFFSLGKEAPYFDLFGISTSDLRPMNLAVVVKDYDIVIGGKKYDGNLVLREWLLSGLNYARLTLDLGEVTLQKGDHININLILLPWGKSNAKNDENVLRVREDSCLSPFAVKAETGKVIEDAYVPMVEAENGEAVFTVSGGRNNGVVRVFGFDTLTRPKVEEKIGGEWKTLDLSSAKTADAQGNAHDYDGIGVYYDGEGKFSYAFVVETKGEPRTFRVTTK